MIEKIPADVPPELPPKMADLYTRVWDSMTAEEQAEYLREEAERELAEDALLQTPK